MIRKIINFLMGFFGFSFENMGKEDKLVRESGSTTEEPNSVSKLYVRNKEFRNKHVVERFKDGIGEFQKYIKGSPECGYKVVVDGETLAYLKICSADLIEIGDILNDTGINFACMAIFNHGLTLSERPPFPGEYTWGTASGKENNEPDPEFWDEKNLCVLKFRQNTYKIKMNINDDRVVIKPNPKMVFSDRVEEHARHLIPVICIPGEYIGLPSIQSLPIVILSKTYDGYVGQTTKKYYGFGCGCNWIGFRFMHGKISFNSDLRFFDGLNVYEEKYIIEKFKDYDIAQEVKTLVSSSSESPSTLININEDLLVMINPTPIRGIKYKKDRIIDTKLGIHRAICRVQSSSLPRVDGDIIYYINDKSDSLLMTFDIT
jgi:hypothetical protein